MSTQETIHVGDRFIAHGGMRTTTHPIRITDIADQWVTTVFEEDETIARRVTIETIHRLLKGTGNGRLTRLEP